MGGIQERDNLRIRPFLTRSLRHGVHPAKGGVPRDGYNAQKVLLLFTVVEQSERYGLMAQESSCGILCSTIAVSLASFFHDASPPRRTHTRDNAFLALILEAYGVCIRKQLQIPQLTRILATLSGYYTRND